MKDMAWRGDCLHLHWDTLGALEWASSWVGVHGARSGWAVASVTDLTCGVAASFVGGMWIDRALLRAATVGTRRH